MDGSKSTRIWRDLYEVNICNIRTKKKEQKAKTWVEFGGWVGRSRAQLWWIQTCGCQGFNKALLLTFLF